MLIKLKNKSEAATLAIQNYAKEKGCDTRVFKGDNFNAISIYGINREQKINTAELNSLVGVDLDKIMSTGYLLSSREFKQKDTSFKVGDVTFGSDELVMMAGPCAIESYEQLDTIAKGLSAQGVKVLRGGAFKPRTSAYSFQGLGVEGLKIAREVCDKYHMLFISELTDLRLLDTYREYVDIIQTGARNSQNFELLKALGSIDTPVLFKRGLSDSIDNFLCAADYIYSGGNKRIILCERGVTGLNQNHYRHNLDINSLLAIRNLSHLPLCIDPSHACGRRDFITPLCMAAITAGASSVLVEVHDNPPLSLCDAKQALSLDDFKNLQNSLSDFTAATKNILKQAYQRIR